MRKLLSLSLAIVMMLSCILGQAVLVNAADAVDYTNAPYAGVYQVISDKAVTLTNETGHVVTLAADVADYFYLIKGANKITTTDDSANVTFTALADNGMAYINEVDEGSVPHLITDTDYAVDIGNGAYLDAGASQTFTVSGVKAGLYYMATTTSPAMYNLKVSSDTGFYDSYDDSSTMFYKNGTDMVLLYLREGTNTLTYTNEGSVAGTITGIRVSKTTSTQTVYADQHFIKGLYVTPYVAPAEPTATPVPTAEPSKITYSAPYAGVYEVTSDKAVTLTNETGHVVTLEAAVTDYFYLIQGNNNITTTDETANLVFTALEDNGMAYINEVDEGNVPHLITDTHYNVDIGSGIYLGAGQSSSFTVNGVKAGLYYMSTVTPTTINNLKVSSDTGFYDVYNATNAGNASYYKTGTDMVLLYLREGANTITYTNGGSVAGTITGVRISKTDDTKDVYADQHFIKGLYVTPYVAAEESFVNNQTANFADGALTFAGKVGADYLDLAYGVEIGGKKFYGAKDGDKVSDGAEGTKVFSFNAWDGSFEIILTNITEKGTAGEKTYKFFVGEDYTEEATVTVE